MHVKVREDRRVVSKAFFVAIGFNSQGKREVLGFDIHSSESIHTWTDFFEGLLKRGLKGVDVVISDAHAGLRDSVKQCLPEAAWQRCQAHFMRNILDKCPNKYSAGLAVDLKTMFSAETVEEARKLRGTIIDEYGDVAEESMRTLDEGFEDCMTVMALPGSMRVSLRTSNYIERENKELRKRESVIQIFPNSASVICLLGAVLMDDHTDWGMLHRSFDMDRYFNQRAQLKEKMMRINRMIA